MAALGRFGDRRQEMRFEVIGDLWATLTTTQPLPLVNLGLGGVLVESPTPLTIGSLHRVRLTLGEEVSEMSAAVRHVTPAPSRPSEYMIGMAFVGLTDEEQRRIAAFILANGGASAAEA